jgi:hypothetical protein
MKQFICCFLLIFIIASCKDNDTPRSVADSYLSALGQRNYESAKKYGTEDTEKLLDMLIAYDKMVYDSMKTETKYEIVGEKISGDKATILYKEAGKLNQISLPMVKKEGKWKVDMTKETLNESESGTMDIGATNSDMSDTIR